MQFKLKPHVVELVLRAKSPIVHGDPAVSNSSNIASFNRQKQVLPIARAFAEDGDDARLLRVIADRHPCTMAIRKLFAQSSTAEVIAVILVRLFIKIYSGQGLFNDVDRYAMLEKRIKSASMKTGSLSLFWAELLNMMQVGIHPTGFDEDLGSIFSLSQKLQSMTISTLVSNGSVIIFKARLWNNALKEHEDSMPERLDSQKLVQGLEVGAANNEDENAAKALDLLNMLCNVADPMWGGQKHSTIVEVPHVSANTIRNRLVRAPGWEHLCVALGLDAQHPGDGDLPLGVEALFVNGGNIESGAKQPNNPEAMANAIRRQYPLLDLLGGVINAVILGRSCLSVNSWLVCRENAAILENTTVADSPNMKISSFHMIDDTTKVRTKTMRGVGQQISNAETLASGTEIFVKLTLTPFTTDLTKGALFAALRTFESMPYIGGQSAVGQGLVSMDIRKTLPDEDELLEQYEKYLEDNRGKLREGLTSGTLNIGDKVLCS